MRYSIVFVASLFFFSGAAFASPIDVASNAWYSATVSKFSDAGYFDETQPFRPTEKATRAEFVQLVVKLQGGVKNAPFTNQSFTDVSPNNPFFNYFEEAGLSGWLKGTGSCYGKHPCSANPNSPINRAEAATLMIRAFNLQMSDKSPTFTDNPSNQWFTLPINSAASLCILQGDAGGKKVRPADSMIRAEMVTMLERALQKLNYPSCTLNANFSLPSLGTATLDSSSSSSPDQSSSSSIPSVSSSERASSSQPVSASFSSISSRNEITFANLRRNMDAWDVDREALTAKIDKMASQPKGADCLKTLDEIDSDWVNNANNYISIMNNINNGGDWLGMIMKIETNMTEIKERIRLAPSYCY